MATQPGFICDSNRPFNSTTLDSVVWPTALAAWQAVAQDFLHTFNERFTDFMAACTFDTAFDAHEWANQWAEELRTWNQPDEVFLPSGLTYKVRPATQKQLQSGDFITPEQGAGFGWDYCLGVGRW